MATALFIPAVLTDLDVSLPAANGTIPVRNTGTSRWVPTTLSALGGVIGPGVAVNNDFAMYDGVTGALLKDSGLALDTDPLLAAASNVKISPQAAIKAYIDVRELGFYSLAVADGVTNNTATLTAELAALGAAGGGTLWLPVGTVKCNSVVTWPANDNCSLAGAGIQATNLSFAASVTGGIVYATPTRIFRCFMHDFSLIGNNAPSGIGLDVADWDRGGFDRLRVAAWDTCIKLTSTATRGALHNYFDDLIVTNGFTNGYWLTGAQGPHETRIKGGEASICGTGINITSAGTTLTGAIRIEGVSVESNTEGILMGGNRSMIDVRFEGNTHDLTTTTNAFYNDYFLGFFDPAKITLNEVTSGIGTNRIFPWGFASSATERLAPLYIPPWPMAYATGSIVPGNGVAVAHLFHVENVRKVSTLTYVPSVTAGNVDLAIANAGGTILASTGSTAVTTVNVRQDIALASPIYIGPGRDYYFYIMFDGGVAGFHGVTASSAAFQVMNNEIGGREKSGLTFPLAGNNVVSGGSGTTKIPIARLG